MVSCAEVLRTDFAGLHLSDDGGIVPFNMFIYLKGGRGGERAEGMPSLSRNFHLALCTTLQAACLLVSLHCLLEKREEYCIGFFSWRKCIPGKHSSR